MMWSPHYSWMHRIPVLARPHQSQARSGLHALAALLIPVVASASDTLAGGESPSSTQTGSTFVILASVLAASGALLICRQWLRSSDVHQNPFHHLKPGQFSSRKQAHLPPAEPSQPIPTLRLPGSDRPSDAAAPAGDGFVYSAAHDLHEPLRKFKVHLHRLESQPAVESTLAIKEEVQQMRRTVIRMQNLLDSLLSLAGIQGRGSLFQKVCLTEVWRDVLSSLEPRIAETAATLTVQGTLPDVEADPIQLEQLFQNLLSNALKFHRHGVPPNIRVTVVTLHNTQNRDRQASDTEGWCEIQIRDNGIGFDAGEWQKMLRGFHRQNDRTRFEGTGLGLAICRSIVDRHSGSLSANSIPNEGSTLILRLPLRQHARSGDTSLLTVGLSRAVHLTDTSLQGERRP